MSAARQYCDLVNDEGGLPLLHRLTLQDDVTDEVKRVGLLYYRHVFLFKLLTVNSIVTDISVWSSSASEAAGTLIPISQGVIIGVTVCTLDHN